MALIFLFHITRQKHWFKCFNRVFTPSGNNKHVLGALPYDNRQNLGFRWSAAFKVMIPPPTPGLFQVFLSAFVFQGQLVSHGFAQDLCVGYWTVSNACWPCWLHYLSNEIMEGKECIPAQTQNRDGKSQQHGRKAFLWKERSQTVTVGLIIIFGGIYFR